VAGLSFLGLQKDKKQERAVPVTAARREQGTEKIQLLALNAPAGRPLTIRMVDGSTVKLEPGAVLRYDSNSYNRNDRVLLLEGQAVFTVAAEKDKPFSVNANGFSTTALGTSFLVATKPAGDIRVRLYTGKVVVRRIGSSNPPMAAVYLQPGQELAYGGKGQQALVSRWEPKAVPAIITPKDIRLAGDTLVFDNAPLASVLDVLHRRYHVAIHYDKAGLSDAYFTGSVLPGDAIELILRTVTRINNLTLIAAGDGFIIK
jgi:ferric-dicitrate binding protein FerR (iron transport regulator)